MARCQQNPPFVVSPRRRDDLALTVGEMLHYIGAARLDPAGITKTSMGEAR
jgi:hypothetical protein